jgi:hypothetical protein
VKKFEFLLKLVLALILAIFAFFIPSIFLKVILSIAALILLAMNMRSYKVLFLILSIVLFIIPVSIYSNFVKDRFNWEWLWGQDFYQGINNSKMLNPDTYIDAAENLVISGSGFKVFFDENSDKIYIPHEIKQSRSGDTLSLSSNSVNKSAFIEVGTKSPYNSIRIEASGLSISGNLTVKDMNIQTLGLSSYVDLQATNFIVNCAGLDLGGELSVDNIDINASGVNWNSIVDAKKIKVSGLGMDINLLVKSAEDIVIQATALNGSLKYLDEWTGTRNLSTYVTYGDLTVIEPSNNEGNLELNISGMINVNRKKY